jgi:hypothetical protein
MLKTIGRVRETQLLNGEQHHRAGTRSYGG